MKTCFIILLLFTISYCDDGFSAKAFYDGLIDWLKGILKELKCTISTDTAINFCFEKTSNNMCEEAVTQHIKCPKHPGQAAPKPTPSTPDEKEQEKKIMIDIWKEKFAKEYYPILIEKYSEAEILKMLFKLIEIIKKDPKYQY